MIFEEMYIDELLEIRKEARINRNWELSDKIRDYLDTQLVFCYDEKGGGQSAYHKNREQFLWRKSKYETMNNLEPMSNRAFMDVLLKQDRQAEARFESWLFTMKKIIEDDKKKTNNQD